MAKPGPPSTQLRQSSRPPQGSPKSAVRGLFGRSRGGLEGARRGTLRLARIRDPVTFVMMVAKLLPKEFGIEARMSFSDEFEAYIRKLNGT